MLKKYLLLLFAFYSVNLFSQGFLSITKATHVFYDSSEFVPTYTIIPYDETGLSIFNVNYENDGFLPVTNLTLRLKVSHVSDPSGNPGIGLVFNDTVNAASVPSGAEDSMKVKRCWTPSILGTYKTDFVFYDRVMGTVQDSTSFLFEIVDSIYAKDYDLFSLSTGSSYYVDSNLNQPGGTVIGDRLATLFEVDSNYSGSSFNYVPTSISFFIATNTNNTQVEIVPKIWRIEEDTLSGIIEFKDEVASAFIPTSFSAGALGSWQTLSLDNGQAVFSGLKKGKYAVGFETTNISPGTNSSLFLGRDTIAEKLQPANSSFVFFGHDTVWYRINDLPGIRLNLGNKFASTPKPCTLVGVNDQELEEENSTRIYPNPSNGLFTLDLKGRIRKIQVFNYNGKLVLEQDKSNSTELVDINLSNENTGVYLLKATTAEGKVVTFKLIMH